MSVPVSFTIPGPDQEAKKFKDKIQKEAMKHGMSMSELIVEAIADYIRNANDKQAA